MHIIFLFWIVKYLPYCINPMQKKFIGSFFGAKCCNLFYHEQKNYILFILHQKNQTNTEIHNPSIQIPSLCLNFLFYSSQDLRHELVSLNLIRFRVFTIYFFRIILILLLLYFTLTSTTFPFLLGRVETPKFNTKYC